MKNLMSLDEAVVVKGWDKNDFCINNYKLHVSDTIVNAWLNVSRLCRLCILVHDSVTNKVRHDLMNESMSSVSTPLEPMSTFSTAAGFLVDMY